MHSFLYYVIKQVTTSLPCTLLSALHHETTYVMKRGELVTETLKQKKWISLYNTGLKYLYQIHGSLSIYKWLSNNSLAPETRIQVIRLNLCRPWVTKVSTEGENVLPKNTTSPSLVPLELVSHLEVTFSKEPTNIVTSMTSCFLSTLIFCYIIECNVNSDCIHESLNH